VLNYVPTMNFVMLLLNIWFVLLFKIKFSSLIKKKKNLFLMIYINFRQSYGPWDQFD